MKRWMTAAAIGLCTCLVMSMCGFTARCEDISERVLRLHVIAASDSEEDQALKLKVRDAVLQETAGLLDGAEDRAEAHRRLETVLPRLDAVAEACLRANGCEDTVSVSLCETRFSTRCYDTFTLPAGDYEALRVVIGEGAGKNWWCVVFPPMCLGSATAAQWDDVLTSQETEIITDSSRYQVRLKIVEWYYALTNKD